MRNSLPERLSCMCNLSMHLWVCRVPTLVVASAGDKLLPSLSESARLQRLMPRCQRVVLPDSGHTALLEVRPLIVILLPTPSVDCSLSALLPQILSDA